MTPSGPDQSEARSRVMTLLPCSEAVSRDGQVITLDVTARERCPPDWSAALFPFG